MNINKIKQTSYTALVILAFLASLLFLIYGMTQTDWHDFDVYYGAARAALTGKSIYITVGKYNLPFWYFPWTAWFYIPLAIFPKTIALFLYKALTIICAILAVSNLTNYYNPKLEFRDKVLILSLIVFMCMQVMTVGQMEFILLVLLIITIHAVDQKKDLLAGIIFPFLWTKPHLLIIFTLFAFWRAGKRTIIVSLCLSLLMLLFENLVDPGWFLKMLTLLQSQGSRIDGLFVTTFPSLLGFRENWLGTANIPITIILIIVAFLITLRFRSLPTIPLLSVALVTSLLCAPRAYAYDLALLIPAMIWLTAREFRSNLWIWFIAAILPPITKFMPATYLVTLMILILCIRKAYNDIRNQNDGTRTNPESRDYQEI